MEGGDASVVCRFQYSGRPLALIVALAAASVGVLVATPLEPFCKVAAAGWVCCAAWSAGRCFVARNARFIRTLVVRMGGEVRVCGDDGHWRRGMLRPGSFVAPWLTLVLWRPEGARLDRAVLVLPGMARPDDFRRLRVMLRWDSSAFAPPAAAVSLRRTAAHIRSGEQP